MVQVIRRGEGYWEVTRVDETADGLVYHETTGRISYDVQTKLFYAEDARWDKEWNGLRFERRPRGFAMHKGALADLLKVAKRGLA